MFKKCLPMFNFHSRRFFQRMTDVDWSKQEQLYMKPFEYVYKSPCKHIELLSPAFNPWLQIPEKKLCSIQDVCRTWITWAIILDDIQDDSLFRHGLPATHRVFSVGAAINAANKGLFRAQNLVEDLGHPLAPKILMKRIEETLYGEGLDMYWRDKCICPSEEAHIEMTRKKSGAYFVLQVELMQLFSSNTTDYTDLVINIGSYYELLDDYYNLLHPKALLRLPMKVQENHKLNSDITEGKITLPIIHAAEFPDVATELADILKQRTSDPVLQNRVISLVKKHGSDEYVRDKLKELEADIREQIAQLGGNPMLTAYMDDMSFQNHEPAPKQELYS